MARKALIFSLAYYPSLVGGAEVAVKEITDRISPDEIEFDMVTLYAGSSRFERIGNVNVYRVGPKIRIVGTTVPPISHTIKFLYVACAFWKSLILYYKRNYDFTWSVMASFNAFSALFFKWIHPRVPFFLNMQEGDSVEHIRRSLGFVYPLYVRIFQKVDSIQAISHFLADYAKNLGATCPITVVPNGVDYAFFSQKFPLSQVKALHHELGIDPFDTVIITTSRLVQKNAVADIIDSLVHLSDSTKLLILGTGPLESMLKEKTALMKLENRVRFVGFVPHRELPVYLRASHVFVRPSLSEGMGVSFVEAMAADLPVVATSVGGIPDFLIDRQTGLFCKVSDPADIAEKVEILMKDSVLREKIVKAAREMVKARYDWGLIAGEMKGIFEKL